jgi:hypothetical protein
MLKNIGAAIYAANTARELSGDKNYLQEWKDRSFPAVWPENRRKTA